MTEAATPVTPVTPSVEVPAVQTPVVQTPVEPVQTNPGPVAQPQVTPEAPQPTSVLGEALAKPPLTVPETPQVSPQATPEAPKVEGQSVEPASPTYEQFKTPENFKMGDEQFKTFTGILSDLETKGKTDHALVQEFGQKAVDYHVAEVTKQVENYNKSLQDSWDKQRNDWKESFMKDPDLGGDKAPETVQTALSFVRLYGGNEQQQTEFRELMNSSGLGNHPAVIRLLANAGKALTKEGQPLAAVKPPQSTQKSRTQTLYGSLAN